MGIREAVAISGYPWWCGGLARCVEGAAGRARAPRWYAQYLRIRRSGGPSTEGGVRASSSAVRVTVGRDLKIETRQIGADLDSLRRYAAELVALAPDVIFSIGSITVASLQQATRTIPIVFMNVPDPVGAGFVESMSHPGGNITGFSSFEYSMSGKWAELLKQIAPHVSRALVFRDPTSAAGIGQFAAVRSVAQSLGVELTPANVRDSSEIERAVAAFARSGNGGVIVTAGGTAAHRKLIISLAARYKLPSVYPYRYWAVDGGLISYGPNTDDPVRRAAGYVDRILKGEKPADMPVQAPTKYELIVNLQDRKGARPDHSAVAARHSGRGHRVGAMSAIGPKRTCKLVSECPLLRV